MSIDAVFPVWLVVLIAVPLTIFFIWKEWKRVYRFRYLRTLAVLFIMISLMCILLTPKYRSIKSSTIILLTPNYSEKKVDSILQTKAGFSVVHTDNTKPYKNSQLISYYDLVERGGEIRFIVGEGLPTYALDLIDNKMFDFIPADLPKGIISLFLPSTAHVNRINFVSGVFNATTDSTWLSLSGPGGVEDSIMFQEKGLNNFSLSFAPRQSGNFLYNVTTIDGTSKKNETLPVHIEKERNLNILFIQHYPTFETQYLKNFLARKNHSMVLRHQLSKNIFRYEYLNRDAIQVNRLTAELLNSFDLLIADQESLQTLSQAEKKSLEKSIQSGLGLLNLSVNNETKNSTTFMPFKTISVKKDTTEIKIGSKSFSHPARPTRVASHPAITPIQKNKSGILSGYLFNGAGKIAFQFLHDTYRLVLSGDSSVYSELWTPLIEQVAKHHVQNSKIKIVSPFPWYENQPLEIEVISSKENPSLSDDSIRLPLREGLIIDDVWHTQTWGGSSGWHTLQTDDGTSLPYYVAPSDVLKSLSVTHQIEANKISSHASFKNYPEEIVAWKDVPRILFYIAFLLAAGFVWLAPKL